MFATNMGFICHLGGGPKSVLEPDLDLALRGLHGVRAVDQVLLDLQAPVAAEVAADGAGAAVVGSVVPARERKPSITR